MLPSAKHTSFSAGGGEPTIQASRLGSLSQALGTDGGESRETGETDEPDEPVETVVVMMR